MRPPGIDGLAESADGRGCVSRRERGESSILHLHRLDLGLDARGMIRGERLSPCQEHRLFAERLRERKCASDVDRLRLLDGPTEEAHRFQMTSRAEAGPPDEQRG